MKFSNRISQVQPSVTLEVNAKAKALKAAGHHVISFAAGEPEFPPPTHFKEQLIQAIEQGNNTYLPALGLLELRQSIAKKYQEEVALDFAPENVIVSTGAKHVLYNAIQTLCDPGDEVLIPAPFWLSYPEQVHLADGKPIIIPTNEEENFQPTIAALEANYSKNSKLLILNSPSNPTGTLYSSEKLTELAEWIQSKEELYVIFDEIYEKLVYDGNLHHNILHVCPILKERCLLVNGFSKSHAITGWRLGYGVGPKDWIKKMGALQSHSTSNSTSVVQYAAVNAYLPENMSFLDEVVLAYAKRRDVMLERLHKLPEISCQKPQGAFYAFPNIQYYLGKQFKGTLIQNTVQFATLLLEEKKIACVPGDAFGAPENIRLSFTVPSEKIAEGLGELESFLTEFSN